MGVGDRRSTPWRWAAAALWLLPVHALLLALSTLTHEPDHAEDFEAWSEYVTTDQFLVSHMVASVLGAALGLVGLLGALVLLWQGPRAARALIGVALTVVGNVAYGALFAIAAFAQPAMGRFFLDGDGGMRDFYDEVYAAPLLTTFAIGSLAWLAGAALVGSAVAGTASSLRWPGYVYGGAILLFPITGFTVQVLQPVCGLVAAGAAVVIAQRLPSAVTHPRTPETLPG